MPDSTAPVDLDLRLVWCFTIVAEHGHFGRAAEVLHTTQPSLSRQIRRLESQLGARLIDRSPQGSRLTEAGETFLPLARSLLRSARQAAARTRAAARPSRLVVGYISGLIVTAAVRELRRHHPEAEIQTLHLDWDEPRAALLDHRVDAVVARLPFPTTDLHVTVLYDEPRVLLVPREHRLAGRESVTLDDIAGEPMPRIRHTPPDWHAFWRAEPRPDGRPVPDGPDIDAVDDKYELIASGDAVAIVPAGVGLGGLRPDLTTIALDGIEPCHVVLATRADDRTNRLLTAFGRYAQAHITPPEDPAD
ncbi:LysR family transcriptional regulator [Prauserella cavernicola]|uniref:LysR family transcriptional regulator n=1 Tax=Prauserella cavernicola TaxID=2800127 RepID=A0A934QVV6_9PSEU|nr:LysR family transcriptional regulator [Prauserella cavernicola]MBK1787370.1 LysR family transcriptional regulator [Prauserella cavernicola]